MEIILVGIVAVITFLSRSINLLGIPIFTDEAIYIRWAQIGLNDPVHRYISLTDGKQPLLTWLMYPFLLLYKDPLKGGRIVSVLSGVGSVIGMYMVGRELFGKKTALLSSLIYIISPFFMVYDRLALMDSLLAMFGIWSLYLSILLIRKVRLDVALILGMVIGAGMLTKSSALFLLYNLPLSLILYVRKQKVRGMQIVKWLGFVILITVLSEVIYNSLRLSPAFYIINQKNHVFIFSFAEFFAKPFAVFYPNLFGLSMMLIEYLTIPVVVAIGTGIIFGFIRKDRRIFYLLTWFLMPFLALAVFGRVLFPRFILFMVPPLLLIAAQVLTEFSYFAWKKMRVFLFVPLLLLLYPSYQSYRIITSPVDAQIPQNDRNQLFDDWPSGYGVREVISYLQNEARDKKIVIGTEGTFGLNPAVYEIYMGLNKNVEIHGYWPVSEIPKELLEKAKMYPTYLIFKEKQEIPSNWPIELITKYKRGKGNTYLLFYKVISPE